MLTNFFVMKNKTKNHLKDSQTGVVFFVQTMK
jgi:hypothetical protein